MKSFILPVTGHGTGIQTIRRSSSGLREMPGGAGSWPDRFRKASTLARPGFVVLSACDSGMMEHLFAPNELAGLPGAFLRAGAHQIICSLWAVHDVASILLWHDFYACLTQGQPAHKALFHAQSYLRGLPVWSMRDFTEGLDLKPASKTRILESCRDLADEATPFQHPLYWAAFVIYRG